MTGPKWRFLIDGNLPPSLCEVFRAHGYEASHVKDLAMEEAEDIDIWKQAFRDKAVIVTKDKDFVSLAMGRPDVCPVIHVRMGNVRHAPLLAKFRSAIQDVVRALDNGGTLIEFS